jgi:hypothetical protein
MFGLKKLHARIAELESKVELQHRLVSSLHKENEALLSNVNWLQNDNCEHEYQLVCACMLHNIALVETGGLFSSGAGNEEVVKTYYHPYEDAQSDSGLIAIYAHRCKHCGHVMPATCFDVAAAADYEWVESVGPVQFNGLRYMVCSGVLKSKKSNNKLDSIIDECEKNDKTS